jgi:ABC-type Fe3+-hydroxamate transport system substrate-binding protein
MVVSLFAAYAVPVEKAAPLSTKIIDQLGRSVTLEKVPERIISLTPSNTEILFALDLGNRVVTVTDQIIMVSDSGNRCTYVGEHSKMGELMAQAVTSTTIRAINKNLKIAD